jgi:hypothetical protein
VDRFFDNFVDITSPAAIAQRAKAFYTKDIIYYVSLGGKRDIVFCFTKFIAMFFGWRAYRPEWRSVWVSEKHIYIKMEESKVVKLPKDKRHQLIVLSKLYDLFEHLSKGATVKEILVDSLESSVDIKDRVFILEDALISWKERNTSWSLRDLLKRERMKSQQQKILFQAFDTMFWHLTPTLAQYNNKYLQIVPRHAFGRVFKADQQDKQEVSVKSRGMFSNDAIPQATLDGYYCECGKTVARIGDMIRHCETHQHKYRKASFTMSRFHSDDAPIDVNDIMENVSSPDMRVRIMIQQIAHHHPMVDRYFIKIDMECDDRYKDILKTFEESQVTEDLFVKFFSLFYGREVSKIQDAWYWLIEDKEQEYVAFPLASDAAGFVVLPKRLSWLRILTDTWKEYKDMFDPVKHEPLSRGSQKISLYEEVEKFVSTRRCTPRIEGLMTRVCEQICRVYPQ